MFSLKNNEEGLTRKDVLPRHRTIRDSVLLSKFSVLWMTSCQESKRSLSTVFFYYFKLWVSERGWKLGIPRKSFMSYQSIFRTLIYIFQSPHLINWKIEERVIVTTIPRTSDWPSVFLGRKVMRLRCHWTPSLFVHTTRNVYSQERSTLSWKTVLVLCLTFTTGNWSCGLRCQWEYASDV